MFSSRHVALIGAAIALVAGVRVAAKEDTGYPLVAIPQGVSALTFHGVHVFLFREGTLTVTAYVAQSPSTGESLVWCPHEEFFVSPVHAELFNARGAYVFGPATSDMDRVKITIGDNGQVKAGRIIASRARSNGTVSGEAGDRYQRWRGNRSKQVGFCKDPLR